MRTFDAPPVENTSASPDTSLTSHAPRGPYSPDPTIVKEDFDWGPLHLKDTPASLDVELPNLDIKMEPVSPQPESLSHLTIGLVYCLVGRASENQDPMLCWYKAEEQQLDHPTGEELPEEADESTPEELPELFEVPTGEELTELPEFL